MKKMNTLKLLSMALLATTVVSCSPYIKLVEVESTNSKANAENNIVFENDTVRVEYDLWGPGGYMNYKVYNKLEVPLYINWFKSSYIKEGVKYSYVGDYRDLSFIPPHSHVRNPVTYVLLKDQGAALYARSNKSGKKIKIENVDIRNDKQATVEMLDKTFKKKGQTKAFSRSYTKENTPLYFRNFITVSTCESADECHNPESMIYFSNQFHVKKMTEMKVKQFNGKGTKVIEFVKRGNKMKRKMTTVYDMPYSAGNRFYIPLLF